MYVISMQFRLSASNCYKGTYCSVIIIYRSRAVFGACAYNSTGRKYAPISEMRLITNTIIIE